MSSCLHFPDLSPSNSADPKAEAPFPILAPLSRPHPSEDTSGHALAHPSLLPLADCSHCLSPALLSSHKFCHGFLTSPTSISAILCLFHLFYQPMNSLEHTGHAHRRQLINDVCLKESGALVSSLSSDHSLTDIWQQLSFPLASLPSFEMVPKDA